MKKVGCKDGLALNIDLDNNVLDFELAKKTKTRAKFTLVFVCPLNGYFIRYNDVTSQVFGYRQRP
jgi:hypothetical protein